MFKSSTAYSVTINVINIVLKTGINSVTFIIIAPFWFMLAVIKQVKNAVNIQYL